MKKILISILLIIMAAQANAKELSHEQIAEAYYKSYNYEKSGNFNDSIKAIALVHQKYNKAYGINIRLAYLYSLNGNYRNSISHYKQAIIAQPNALSPLLGLMNVYILAKDYEQASKRGFQILSIDYYNYYGNLKLAYILRQTEKLELAEKILLKMLTVYPSDKLYLTELGLLKLKQKDFEQTKILMQSVQILDPENIAAKSTLLSLEKN
jgi:tetratricopeptide (TPR) repeat protein